MLDFKTFSIKNEALKNKELPHKLKVLNWGTNETTNGDVVVNDETLKYFNSWQKQTGRDDVAIDFDHNTVPGSKSYVAGAPKAIAGYGKPNLIKGDGLYLENIEWTETGEKYARDYKDLSPAAMLDGDGIMYGLDSVALTPNGAVAGLTFYSAKTFKELVENMNVMNFSTKDEINKLKQQYKNNPGDPAIRMLSKEDEDCDDYSLHLDCDSADTKKPYGDVEYADSKNNKYPIDTKEHAKAAWSYINMPKNAAKYNESELATIKNKIKSAAKKHGITISTESSDSDDYKTKTMSADNSDKNIKFPKAYLNEAPEQKYLRTMLDEQIKQTAADNEDVSEESLEKKILFALLAKYIGVKPNSDLINSTEKADEGGLKSFSVESTSKISVLEAKVKELEEKNKQDKQSFLDSERAQLLADSAKEGKIVPLSADECKNVDINILKSIVSRLQTGVVPLEAKMKTYNASSDKKVVGNAKTRDLYNAMLKNK